MPADYSEAERLLMGLPRFADQGSAALKPGLDRIEALLDVMGRPETGYPIVHVAGTNGKGSVASFAASILTTAGLKTGLHTSPHLLEVGERMRVDGVAARREWLADRVLALRNEMALIEPSFFEMTVALSLLSFAEADVDAAVIEVGLGGRLDATNVVSPALSAITSIGLDHTDILGDTIEKVAFEKAGIIKAGVPVVTGVDQSAEKVISAIARTRDAPYENVRDTCRVHRIESSLMESRIALDLPSCKCPDVLIDLPMRHQERNALLGARCAERILNALEMPVEAATITEGLETVRSRAGLRGRFDVLSRRPLVVADVAHNSEGIVALVKHVRGHLPDARLVVCMAMMKDKDIDGLGPVLAAVDAHVLAVSVNSPRAHPAERLTSLLKQSGPDVDNSGTVDKAIEWFLSGSADDDVLLVTGSHLAVADAMRHPTLAGIV